MHRTEPAEAEPAAPPVPLPAPLRILDAEEYLRAVTAARRAGGRDGVGLGTAEEIAAAALISAGLFPPADVEELDAECCTAQCLAWDAVAPPYLGEWHQCGDEPGHEGADHDNGEFAWSDGQPGTIPARKR
ncbi:hypothetical protein [Streptomyces cinereoruber]|uniref:hypothetical protein n=1 Tax=Streptomyces cinereoruber TaxID=67260 RepID=UPI003C2F94EC